MQDRPCTRAQGAPLCRYYKHYPKYERIENYLVEYYSGTATDDYNRKGMNMKKYFRNIKFKIGKLILRFGKIIEINKYINKSF